VEVEKLRLEERNKERFEGGTSVLPPYATRGPKLGASMGK
jgi:hypothetical protein